MAAIEWYHTIELGPDLVTPGWFDTRAVPARCGFPVELSGSRCLDVGTFDGFWAFEMERRGAAEVVAIDVLDPRQWDWPLDASPEAMQVLGRRKGRGEGFELVHRALGSSVKRLEVSVYDLDPASIGQFDFVYVGSLLLHLRDPVRAIERVASVCRGEALFVDAVDVRLSLMVRRRPAAILDGRGRPWWWKPNVAGLRRMIEAGGFAVGTPARRFLMPPGPAQRRDHPTWGQLARRGEVPRREALRAAWSAVISTRRGDPHAAITARPRGHLIGID